MVVRRIARIRPRTRRIAPALVRRDSAIAHIAEGAELHAPAIHRFRKAMQQQYQRRATFAGGEGVSDFGSSNGTVNDFRRGKVSEKRLPIKVFA